MDIGLDSFPYPGVTTMVDALIAGLPTITLESMTLRCSQGAAIVSSIGLNEVISSNHDDYCEKVFKLAKDSAYRDSLKVKINRAMANNPSFLNVDAFSKACVKEYFRIHEELKALG
jgi:predicted O-linked N-acetylglucosamine transferase (SPINDLY family)